MKVGANRRVDQSKQDRYRQTIECRKIYWQDFDPGHFLNPAIDRNYPQKDYHRIYYGEILAVQGTQQYGV